MMTYDEAKTFVLTSLGPTNDADWDEIAMEVLNDDDVDLLRAIILTYPCALPPDRILLVASQSGAIDCFKLVVENGGIRFINKEVITNSTCHPEILKYIHQKRGVGPTDLITALHQVIDVKDYIRLSTLIDYGVDVSGELLRAISRRQVASIDFLLKQDFHLIRVSLYQFLTNWESSFDTIDRAPGHFVYILSDRFINTFCDNQERAEGGGKGLKARQELLNLAEELRSLPLVDEEKFGNTFTKWRNRLLREL